MRDDAAPLPDERSPDELATAVLADRVLTDACDLPLVYLVPTRGRPQGALHLTEAWRSTGTGCAALVLVVDDDDPELDRYRDIGWPHLIVGPRLRLGGTLNWLAPRAAELGAQAVGFMGDDHRPRSLGWDTALLGALRASGPGVAYGNDLFQAGRLPTAVAISGEIVEALGFYVPPGMVHLYLDDWWRHLGEALGALTYLPDVVIEHLHPAAGKGQWDPGYLEVNSTDAYQADHQRWQAYLHGRWPDDLARLHKVLAHAEGAADG
jgi:hypothetical protein